jgi:predicted GIY-YIG superfamily endonuclease
MNGDAIGGENQLKAGNRSKKETLIQIMNPNWDDLYENIKDITTFQPFKEFYIINL